MQTFWKLPSLTWSECCRPRPGEAGEPGLGPSVSGFSAAVPPATPTASAALHTTSHVSDRVRRVSHPTVRGWRSPPGAVKPSPPPYACTCAPTPSVSAYVEPPCKPWSPWATAPPALCTQQGEVEEAAPVWTGKVGALLWGTATPEGPRSAARKETLAGVGSGWAA